MMKKEIAEKLVELGIYKEEFLSKEGYEELCNKAGESEILVIETHKSEEDESIKWYKVIHTNGITEDEVEFLLKLDRNKNIRSIKSMVKFFVVLTVIGMIVVFYSGLSFMDALEGIR